MENAREVLLPLVQSHLPFILEKRPHFFLFSRVNAEFLLVVYFQVECTGNISGWGG